MRIVGDSTIIETNTYTAETLHLIQETGQTADSLKIDTSDNTNLFIIKNNGYVGINKANPGERLDVDGNITATNNITAGISE